MCWHYGYWKKIPDERKSGNQVICFFHHHLVDRFDDSQIIAGVCMNKKIYKALKLRQPDKAVWIVNVGGIEDAVPYARRVHKTEKIRLFMAGNAMASTTINGSEDVSNHKSPRKGAELILLIADKLDKRDYSWVFVGPGWEPYATILTNQGWTVIHPGSFIPAPRHFEYFGEGDIYLMLSRLEGGPLTLLETMGLGMWPICTNTGLAPEILQHGLNGHLVQAYDGSNTNQVVNRVVEHIRSLDKLALQEYKKVVRNSVLHFTWNNFQKEIDKIIQECFKYE
jgi:glycosyltransferase involved in cell wall biosynthesis